MRTDELMAFKAPQFGHEISPTTRRPTRSDHDVISCFLLITMMAVNANLSNDANKSPIFKLNEDLVWRIFLFDADLSDEIPFDGGRSLAPPSGQDPAFIMNGLTVTLRTSQVCQSWRSMILKSTVIWGRLIDLHILEHCGRMKYSKGRATRCWMSRTSCWECHLS